MGRGEEQPRPPEGGRKGPLAGVKIVDLTHMLAGPYCTWVLGALGADVIKVEMPKSGDFTRSIRPFADEQSVYFCSVNRNKRGITLNLKVRLGARQCYVSPPSATSSSRTTGPARCAASVSITILSLEAIPALSMRRSQVLARPVRTASGRRSTPWFRRCRRIMSITGEEKGPPSRVGTSIGDIGASLFGAVGVLAALNDRATTGRGMHVDIAMFDAQLALLENAVARYLNVGDVPRRLGFPSPADRAVPRHFRQRMIRSSFASTPRTSGSGFATPSSGQIFWNIRYSRMAICAHETTRSLSRC